MKKTLSSVLALATCLTMFSACGKKDNRNDEVILGDLIKNAAEEDCFSDNIKSTHSKPKFFNSLNELLLALNIGKITQFTVPSSVAGYIAANNEGVSIQKFTPPTTHDDPVIDTVQFNMATRESDYELCSEISGAIKTLKDNGTMERLIKKHITTAKGDPSTKKALKSADDPAKINSEKTYKVGVTGDMPPLDYISADGTPTGYSVALMEAIGEELNCNFVFVQVSANARLTALESEKIDVVFWNCLLKVDGYEPSCRGLSFTIPYFEDTVVIVSNTKKQQI